MWVATLVFHHVQGHDFPADLSPYKLVIHCGACTQNRREMLNKILKCQQAGVPITNYGLVIAYSLGIFERALSPFPSALDVWRKRRHHWIASDIVSWLRRAVPRGSKNSGTRPTRCAGST